MRAVGCAWGRKEGGGGREPNLERKGGVRCVVVLGLLSVLADCCRLSRYRSGGVVFYADHVVRGWREGLDVAGCRVTYSVGMSTQGNVIVCFFWSLACLPNIFLGG